MVANWVGSLQLFEFPQELEEELVDDLPGVDIHAHLLYRLLCIVYHRHPVRRKIVSHARWFIFP